MTTDASKIWSPPARRRVFLLRHAEVDYFDRDGRPQQPATVSLNEQGLAQAAAVAAALTGVPFDLAVCSGLNRTRQTAERVLAGRGVPLHEEPRLREIEMGKLRDWAGGTPEDARRALLEALGENIDPSSRFLGGETFEDLGGRVAAAWLGLFRQRWRTALVVAHSVVNRLLLSWALGAPLGSLGRIEQDACCVNLIEVEETGVPLVRLVNHTPWSPAKDGLTHSTLEGLYLQFLRGR
jgi:probable phosphoglycerate mutase